MILPDAATRARFRGQYDLTVLAWNVRVTRPYAQIRPQLRAWLSAHQPDVAVLIECYHVADDIAHDLGDRWRVIYDTTSGSSEAHDVVILVRRDANLTLNGKGFLRETAKWVGPNQRHPKDGRVMPWVDVAKHGRAYRILGVHRISGRRIKANRAAWAAETRMLRNCALTSRGRIYVEVGDRNQSKVTGGWLYARSIAGRYTTGAGPDAAVVVGATATSHNLGKGGSDHYAFLWHIEKG